MVCSPRLGALAVRGKGLEQLVGFGGKQARRRRMWTCEVWGKTAMGVKGSECCVKILPFLSAVTPSCKESRAEILWSSSNSTPRGGRKTTCTFLTASLRRLGVSPRPADLAKEGYAQSSACLSLSKLNIHLEKTTDVTFSLFFSTLGVCAWIQWDGRIWLFITYVNFFEGNFH